jgi:hypothetical protein
MKSRAVVAASAGASAGWTGASFWTDCHSQTEHGAPADIAGACFSPVSPVRAQECAKGAATLNQVQQSSTQSAHVRCIRG